MIYQWMSEGCLWLIYTRAAHIHWIGHNLNMAHTLTRAYRCYLEVDARRSAENAAEDIGSCLDLPQGNTSDLQGAY